MKMKMEMKMKMTKRMKRRKIRVNDSQFVSFILNTESGIRKFLKAN